MWQEVRKHKRLRIFVKEYWQRAKMIRGWRAIKQVGSSILASIDLSHRDSPETRNNSLETRSADVVFKSYLKVIRVPRKTIGRVLVHDLSAWPIMAAFNCQFMYSIQPFATECQFVVGLVVLFISTVRSTTLINNSLYWQVHFIEKSYHIFCYFM